MKDEKILVGLSGGINSAAVLCWLVEQKVRPKELHLYYAHFKEHSPDTFQFVADLIRYARTKFDNVHVTITKNSVINFFRGEKMIPHPMISPCSRKLKIEPMSAYCFNHGITIDLIGYVKHELKKRTSRQAESMESKMFEAVKSYPIGEFTDEWCFEIVSQHIGWYPAIYDIRDENGKRIFLHNNCLPCKNMTVKQMQKVEEYFPNYHMAAVKLAAELTSYWGRDSAQYYTTFMREDIGQESTCEHCKF